MTPEEKTNLRKLFEAPVVAVMSNQDGSYVQSPEDLDFHHVIIKSARNPILFNILCGDLYPQIRIFRRAHKNIPGYGERAHEEHRRILVTIEEGDSEISKLLMRRHIALAREELKKLR